MRKTLIIIFSFFIHCFGIFDQSIIAQSNDFSKTLKGEIIDKQSFKPLAFAHIFNKNSLKGTVSDENGSFAITYLSLEDTIIATYIGYKTESFVVSSLVNTQQIKLSPSAELMSEFSVLADNQILYGLVDKSRKNYNPDYHQAKTYFQLSTEIQKEEVEFIEGYYNASILGYDILDLQLKNGRLAVQKKDNRFFVSTESSRIFTMSSTIGTNEYFPTSPLQLNKRKLKKYFDLSLIKRYTNEIGHRVYLLSFRPKIDNGYYFSGKLWIDSSRMVINKLELSISNASKYPFVAIWQDDRLESVDMNISKSFEVIDNKVRLNHIDFNYDLTYLGRSNEQFEVKTKALLYAFDYNSTYHSPYFEHSNTKHGDYSKISALPYNTFFWENCIEFTLPRNRSEPIQFNDTINAINSRKLFGRNTEIKRGFFEQPYKIWDGTRITFKSNNEVKPTLATSSYDLHVQIYLDVNETDNEMNILSAAIFDPFLSYYESEITNRTSCFINMYFDLMEIKRRELISEISELKLTAEEIDLFYENKMREIRRFSEDFYNEVKRGNDKQKMEKWNEVIKTELEIDNIELFKPFQNG